jgi:hypothetical protein
LLGCFTTHSGHGTPRLISVIESKLNICDRNRAALRLVGSVTFIPRDAPADGLPPVVFGFDVPPLIDATPAIDNEPDDPIER